MTDPDFLKGWALLLAQPYAKDYCIDAAKQTVQRNVYLAAFRSISAERWRAVVSWWIQHETRWPFVVDLRNVLASTFPVPKAEPLTAQALLTAPTDASHEPWPSVVRAWIQGQGKNIVSVGLPIVREWVAVHPEDSVTAEHLAQWEAELGKQEQAA